MLYTTVIEGSIKYALGDIKFSLTSPKTGEVKQITVDYKDLEKIVTLVLRDIRQAHSRHEYAQAAAVNEGYAMCRALTIIRQLLQGGGN